MRSWSQQGHCCAAALGASVLFTHEQRTQRGIAALAWQEQVGLGHDARRV